MGTEILQKIDNNIMTSHKLEFLGKPPKYNIPIIKFLVQRNNKYYLIEMLNHYVINYPNQPKIEPSAYPIDILVYNLDNDESIIMPMQKFIDIFSLSNKVANNIDTEKIALGSDDLNNEFNTMLNTFSEIISDKNSIDIKKYNDIYYPKVLKFLNDDEKKYYHLFLIDEKTNNLKEITPEVIISNLLDINIDDLKNNSKRLDCNATYYYNPNRGGRSMILSDDGTYLSAGSSISFETLLEEFQNGKRNGNLKNVYRVDCPCGHLMFSDPTNLPKDMKSYDVMCPKCHSFFKFGNPNYEEPKVEDYNKLNITCHECNNVISIDVSKLPTDLKTFDIMCPKCNSFIKYGNPNYQEIKNTKPNDSVKTTKEKNIEEKITHSIKLKDESLIYFDVPRNMQSLEITPTGSYKLANSIVIMNEMCSNEKIFKKRASDWLKMSAKKNNQKILDELERTYTIDGTSIEVLEKVALTGNNNRYYKFIYFDEKMITFAYNNKNLSNQLDEIIASIRDFKNHLKVERNPFEKPNSDFKYSSSPNNNQIDTISAVNGFVKVSILSFLALAVSLLIIILGVYYQIK